MSTKPGDLQFRRESLFHPVRHVKLLPEGKAAQDDVAAARGELLKGFQQAIGSYRAGAANDHKDDIEVDIFEDPDGPPAVSTMTRGSTKSTFGEGAAGPGREITRKIAFASPAGFVRYFTEDGERPSVSLFLGNARDLGTPRQRDTSLPGA